MNIAGLNDKMAEFISSLGKKDHYFAICLLKPPFCMSWAYGYANNEEKVLVDNNSVFRLASVSKMFTQISCLKLHEEKKLNIYEDCKQYDVGLSNVTMHDLLTHTSGLQDNRMIIDSYNGDNPQKGGLNYSGRGYTWLAEIIEAVTELSYGDYLQENIFDVYGMSNSGLVTEEGDYSCEPFVKGHWHDFRDHGASSNYGNIADMQKFLIPLFKGEIVDLKLLLSFQQGFSDYSLDLYHRQILSSFKGKVVYYKGGLCGWRTGVLFHPGLQLVVGILAATQSECLPEEIAKLIIDYFKEVRWQEWEI